MVKSHKEVALEDQWDITPLFKNEADWARALKSLTSSEKRPYWPELAAYQGKLAESASAVKKLFDLQCNLDRKLGALYTWAHLSYDVDIGDDAGKQVLEKATSLLHAFAEECSWIEPELLALPETTLKAYLASKELMEYKFSLQKIFRLKAHTLSQENERLLALAAKPLGSNYKTFKALTDADFNFGQVEDAEGKLHELTQGSYAVFLRSQDRVLRKNAFLKLHGKFEDYQNTMAELLNGAVQNHLFNARARNYATCLEASLYPKNIDPSVYKQLIKTVNENLPLLHRYINLRKRALGLKDFHLYDAYVPLVKDQDFHIPYNEAVELVVESVAPLGEAYQTALAKGLTEQRWVDRYENKNKRSGAYSSGCYDSHPYILMNYKDMLRDLSTLAHEAGHSMHTYHSNKKQPYHYADYPIFVAEVASTFNEELLFRTLLKRCKNEQERLYLINQKIEDIRGTFFRQTMFAEFELAIHTFAEEGIPLTPDKLKETYVELNQKYFGKEAVIDCHADMEWARIPHFYTNFYVYQYATGISAALTLADLVGNGSHKERDAYLNFLSSGGSNFPTELLKIAGVNMGEPTAVQHSCAIFEHYLEELEQHTQTL